jgi:pSer/pThr/pTyr-binding forkhead associated (FHA) protein
MDVQLILFKDDGEHKEFKITSDKTVIGRAAECDLRIPLPEVSRKHSLVIASEKAVTLRDLGSANGTYVNNRKISEQDLSAGDHIVVGPVVFTVRINGEPSEIKPVQTRLEAKSGSSAEHVSAKSASQSSKPTPQQSDSESDEDPISALEALAGSGDTAALDLEGSSLFGLDDDDEDA